MTVDIFYNSLEKFVLKKLKGLVAIFEKIGNVMKDNIRGLVEKFYSRFS